MANPNAVPLAATGKRLRIVLPGGSGQVGQMLARHFHSGGHEVTVLSREPRREPRLAPWTVLAWNGRTLGLWTQSLEAADVCINLAGRSVNCRYTAANQAEILHSRVRSTALLQEVIGSLAHPPRVWLNASTATIYRHSLDRPMDEETGELGGGEPGAPRKWDYSVHVAKEWERAFFADPTPRTRKVALRTAITFHADRGSVFALLSTLVRAGLGGSDGNGRQFVSWIHEVDFLRAIDWLIAEQSFAGVVNLAAPFPLPNSEFMRALRKAWHQPIGLPASRWMIEAAGFLLRTESELVLKSRYVIPGRLAAAGFRFRFSSWPQAAEDLVERFRRSCARG